MTQHHIGPSHIWEELPFNEILAAVLRNNKNVDQLDRSFITPDAYSYITHDNCTRHNLLFYANQETFIELHVDIDSEGLIAHSDYINTYKHTQKGVTFERSQGEDLWHHYCMSFFDILYKHFLL